MKWQSREPRSAEGLQALSRAEYLFEIITPVFGGGVALNLEPRANVKPIDTATPIRGAGVRGQLRAWWRALYGVACGSVREMRERETALWGAASRPGVVSLSIVDYALALQDVPIFSSEPNRAGTNWNPRPISKDGSLAYGAFPLQHTAGLNARGENGTLQRVTGTARLVVTDRNGTAAVSPEVSDAVEAWLTFGGIGGRTRRGFGCARRVGAHDAEQFALELAARLPTPRLPLPSFKNHRLVFGRPSTGPDTALEFALSKLKAFRQGEGRGRNPGANNHPGRSRWPEPDEIRRIQHTHHQNHRPQHLVRKFPRAAFGMPIIFHFKDAADPGNSTLVPRGKERLASPLRLGVIREGERKFRPFALVLSNREVLPAELRYPGASTPVETVLATAEASWHNSPLNGESDVLQAFLTFFAEGTTT